jgi:hypothetical protein
VAREHVPATPHGIAWDAIPSPVFKRGDARIAYRDPAGHYHDGIFRVFHTLVEREKDGHCYLYTAVTESVDLVHWSASRRLTPRDQRLNYSSPGNVVRWRGRWLLCLQTYPTPHNEPYGDRTARLFTMGSNDLVHWSAPRLLRVKGPGVPVEEMGRMIDPYLVEDKDRQGRWWCFYKQRGVSMSYSDDLETWTYHGRADAGENVCVLVDVDQDAYLLIHSPRNGVGLKRSRDLVHWQDLGLTTLGQHAWPWAQGRLTAAHVLDLRAEPRVGRYVMFYHGSSPAGVRERETHGHSSLAVAWSHDLQHWEWPS